MTDGKFHQQVFFSDVCKSNGQLLSCRKVKSEYLERCQYNFKTGGPTF